MKNSPTKKELKEELFYAIHKNDIDSVEKYVLADHDPDIMDDHRTTILMYAAENGWEHIVELLLKNGANTDIQNFDNATALRKAINTNIDQDTSYNIVKLLLDNKANPNLIERTKYSPLTWAVCYRHEKTASLLLENRANPDIQTSVIKKTAIMFAAYQGRKALVNTLLDKKAELDIQSSNGSTALLDAIEQGHYDIAKTLLKAGANPNLLGGQSDSRTPLMAAIAAHNLELTKTLIDEYGADINITNNRGWTATTYAISVNNKSEFLAEIIKHRPNTNQQDDRNYTNIMRAVMVNEYDKIDLLLKQKPNLNLQNNKGETALIRCVHLLKEPERIVRKLLEHGADPNIKDNNGQTALDIFMKLERDNETLVTLLTKGYAKIKLEEVKQVERKQSSKRSQLRKYIKQNRLSLKP